MPHIDPDERAALACVMGLNLAPQTIDALRKRITAFLRSDRESAESSLANMSEKMRKALEPFAEFARSVAADHPGWDHDQFSFGYPFPETFMRDLRRAREALSAPPEGREQGIEEAANVVERLGKASLTFTNHAAAEAAKAIRALASPQEKTDG